MQLPHVLVVPLSALLLLSNTKQKFSVEKPNDARSSFCFCSTQFCVWCREEVPTIMFNWCLPILPEIMLSWRDHPRANIKSVKIKTIFLLQRERNFLFYNFFYSVRSCFVKNFSRKHRWVNVIKLMKMTWNDFK